MCGLFVCSLLSFTISAGVNTWLSLTVSARASTWLSFTGLPVWTHHPQYNTPKNTDSTARTTLDFKGTVEQC